MGRGRLLGLSLLAACTVGESIPTFGETGLGEGVGSTPATSLDTATSPDSTGLDTDATCGGGCPSSTDTESGPTSDPTQASDETPGTTTDSADGPGTSDGPGVMCGDGMIGGSEECDDAGESESCDADCTLASCGDGTANMAAGEQCDDAGASAECDDDCSTATCGDGHVNPSAGEDCDVGGESAMCDIDCTTPSCGDGHANANAGEQCDDAGQSAACDINCTVASCGDGYANGDAGEQCDGGGETAGCDDDCTNVSCGDSNVNAAAGEQCDDGGMAGGDGCSASCQSENPDTCVFANGLTWCFDNNACGEACNSVCAALGMSVIADDNAWLAAQDTDAECATLATALGMAGANGVSSYTYACLEDSGGNDTIGGGLTGFLYCSNYAGCPSEHRTTMDQGGIPCGPGAWRSICPCE